jgi:ATP-dependent exoDNAse (exonuclease V) beta subunit (contains helicase and exonuclease domains)
MPRWTDEQLLAINESGKNIIISAGAGSGKTAVLTERVIRKLQNGIHVNELLVLTFTKAAAAEMKERIRKAIKKEPNLIEELEYIDNAYIATFDSFALSVVKKYHYILGIDKDIEIAEASLLSLKKKQILEEVFEYFYDNEDSKFTNLINKFCVKDDNTLKNSILSISYKLELKYNIQEYLNNYINDLDLIKYINEYNLLIEEKKIEINECYKELLSLSESKFYKDVEDYIEPILAEQDKLSLKLLLDLSFPSLPRGSLEDIKIAKERLVLILKDLQDLISYGDNNKVIEDINKTREGIEVIIDILKDYFNRLTEYKKENNLYEFNDIALYAIKILEENEDIRIDLKNYFKEILVDEYQDTNDLQELFINLIENNNLYMVGDIKQSIYRFRNANPYIFKNKYDKYSSDIGGIKIDLLKNFRSRDEVLKDINAIFNQVMDNDIGGADYLKSHQMLFGNNSYNEEGKTNQNYSCDIFQYENPRDLGFTKEEQEAFFVANDIKNKIGNKYEIFDKDNFKKRSATYNDFVILMDRSTQFDLYKKIFEYVGIPLTLYKDENLNSSEDIYIIKNLIDMVLRIKDKDYGVNFKYDYTSIGRSFLFRLTDEEIFDTVTNSNFFNTDIYKKLFEVSNYVNSDSPYELLNKIIGTVDFYQKGIEVGDIDSRMIRIDKIIQSSIQLGNNGYDIYQFKDYLENLLEEEIDIKYSLNTDTGDSVRIMTIHKSKGLEYPICYYSGLYKEFNIRDIKDKFIYNEKYGFIVPYFEEGIRESILKVLMKKNYLEEEISEKIRLFYVALTRAKEKMIFILPKEDLNPADDDMVNILLRKKYKSFSSIIYSLSGNIKNQFNIIPLDNNILTKDYLYSKDIENINFKDNGEICVEELDIETNEKKLQTFSKSIHKLIDSKTSNNIKLGLEIHDILEYIDFKNPKLDDIENKFVKDKIKKFLSQTFFNDIKEANIYKEYEFIYEEDNIKYHGIIDCMIEYQNHIDIIDYKLKNIYEEEYNRQLIGYKNYISKLTDKDVNIYLYSILDGKSKEL